jgi:hypothetical protein
MTAQTPDYAALLTHALARYHDGFDPALIELPEQSVFPYLIPVQPTTGRKSRTTGLLLGRQAPHFIKRGRSVRYRLKDVLDWLADAALFSSTAEVVMKNVRALGADVRGAKAKAKEWQE